MTLQEAEEVGNMLRAVRKLVTASQDATLFLQDNLIHMSDGIVLTACDRHLSLHDAIKEVKRTCDI